MRRIFKSFLSAVAVLAFVGSAAHAAGVDPASQNNRGRLRTLTAPRSRCPAPRGAFFCAQRAQFRAQLNPLSRPLRAGRNRRAT